MIKDPMQPGPDLAKAVDSTIDHTSTPVEFLGGEGEAKVQGLAMNQSAMVSADHCGRAPDRPRGLRWKAADTGADREGATGYSRRNSRPWDVDRYAAFEVNGDPIEFRGR